MKDPPKPPAHLRKSTAKWWSSVVAGFELEDHHRKLLTLAAEAWDRGCQAREAIKKHGMIYQDRFGQPRSRPEVSIERDARIAFARLVRELGLDVFDPNDKKPPTISGGAHRRR